LLPQLIKNHCQHQFFSSFRRQTFQQPPKSFQFFSSSYHPTNFSPNFLFNKSIAPLIILTQVFYHPTHFPFFIIQQQSLYGLIIPPNILHSSTLKSQQRFKFKELTIFFIRLLLREICHVLYLHVCLKSEKRLFTW